MRSLKEAVPLDLGPRDKRNEFDWLKMKTVTPLIFICCIAGSQVSSYVNKENTYFALRTVC